jgi:predicted aspartyl protease
MWQTEIGKFITNTKSTVLLQLPQFTTRRNIVETLQVIPERENAKYDIIIGQYVLTKIGMIVNFREGTLEWDELTL